MTYYMSDHTVFAVGLAVLFLTAVFGILYYKNRENFEVVGKFVQPLETNPGQSFTLQPIDETYIFADPIPDEATSFDRILSRFVDTTIPGDVLRNASFPEAAPYADSEVENISKKALERIQGPDAPILDFITVDYAAKGVDSNKNIHYDIAFVVFDQVKNYSLKLVLVCLLDSKRRLFIKKFASFNSFVPDRAGPRGVEHVDDIFPAPFLPAFVDFKTLYKNNESL
jgi:hypothetical protein